MIENEYDLAETITRWRVAFKLIGKDIIIDDSFSVHIEEEVGWTGGVFPKWVIYPSTEEQLEVTLEGLWLKNLPQKN